MWKAAWSFHAEGDPAAVLRLGSFPKPKDFSRRVV